MQGDAVATRYARALAEIAFETKVQDKFRRELESVIDLMTKAPELGRVLAHPGIKLENRKNVLREVIKRFALSKLVVNFLNILLDKRRILLLPQILNEFRSMSDEVAGVVRAKVTAAFPLNDAHRSRLAMVLSKLTGKRVVLDEEVDLALIGGLVTRIEGRVYDGSVKTQLDQLRSNLLEEL